MEAGDRRYEQFVEGLIGQGEWRVSSVIPSAALAGLLMQDPLEGQTWLQRLPQAQTTGQEAFAVPPVFAGETAPVFSMPELIGREHLAPPMTEYSDIPDWLPALASPYGGWGGGYMQARRRGLR